nr:uncharacterized protein LOC123495136 [Aegilops tauschii subsp. strangulata]
MTPLRSSTATSLPLPRCSSWGGGGGAADEWFKCRCALVLSAAVAALLAFTQQNVTGPPRKYSPFPFFSTSSLDDGLYSDAGGKQDQWASFDSHVHGKFVPFWTSSLDERWYSDPGGKWEAWASHHLASFGSHVHGKFLLLQFIVFAELLLTSIKSLDSDLCSVSWWLCRLSMSQQNILDELSSSLFDQVQVYKNKMLAHFGELERVSSYWGSFLCDGEGSSLVSAALLEAGLAEYKYGRVDASRIGAYVILLFTFSRVHNRRIFSPCYAVRSLLLTITCIVAFKRRRQ